MVKVVACIQNFNLPEMTDVLVCRLRRMSLDVIVCDDSSDPSKIYPGAAIVTGHVGYSKGLNMVLKAGLDSGASHVWLLNNDVEIKMDVDYIPRLVLDLEGDGAVTPASTPGSSGWRWMVQAGSNGLRPAPFLEGYSQFMTRRALELVWPFDEDASVGGWGLDIEAGWKWRQAGMKVAVDDRLLIRHLQSMAYKAGGHELDVEAYCRKSNEGMHAHMARKYGTDWFGRMTK